VHLPFNFQLVDAPWEARSLATLIADYEAALPPGGWPNWVLGNHDRPRVAAKRGQAQARVAAMLLLTLRGTPTLYYGDELGLSDVAISPAQTQDPRELREPGLALGRDPVRTPSRGTEARMPASPRPSRGCRSMPTGRRATWRGWGRSLIQS
jgi:glycosidase